MSFLRVGDPKVLVLDIGDRGKRWGSVRELGRVEVTEDSEEMDMAVV